MFFFWKNHDSRTAKQYFLSSFLSLKQPGIFVCDLSAFALNLACMLFVIAYHQSRGPFLETPGNITGPKSYFEIEVSRKVGCVLTSNEVHFVSLANNFTEQLSKLLKLPSGMENKTA